MHGDKLLAPPLLSIVLSFRNEAAVIPALLDRLEKVLGNTELFYEIIFVNDASTDESLTLLKKKAAQDSRVKVLNMSRRFGVAPCASAGLRHAKGDAVIMMDADLQDPPELIPQLIEKWRAGAEIAYTIRTSRDGESKFKIFLTHCAYKILRVASSDVDLPVEAGDFRLLSRRVLDELLKINDPAPYFRGLVRSLGFRQSPVYYEREKRFAGKSHFPLWSRGPMEAFLTGLLSFSTLPLDLSFYIGGGLTLLGFATLAILISLKIFQHSVAFWIWGISFFALIAGLQLFSVGLLGFYLSRIYRQTQNRPSYIIESSVNILSETENIFSS